MVFDMPTIASMNKKVQNSSKGDSPSQSMSPRQKEFNKTHSNLKIKDTQTKKANTPTSLSPTGARDTKQSFHYNFKLNKDIDEVKEKKVMKPPSKQKNGNKQQGSDKNVMSQEGDKSGVVAAGQHGKKGKIIKQRINM